MTETPSQRGPGLLADYATMDVVPPAGQIQAPPPAEGHALPAQHAAPPPQQGFAAALLDRVRNTSEAQGGRGSTRIADEVVEKIAAIAAREVEGVHDLGGDAARVFQSVRERIGLGGGDKNAQGVSVELTGQRAEVRLTLVVEFGYVVLSVCEAVRTNVIESVERMLGLEVTEVNIVVDDIHTS